MYFRYVSPFLFDGDMYLRCVSPFLFLFYGKEATSREAYGRTGGREPSLMVGDMYFRCVSPF